MYSLGIVVVEIPSKHSSLAVERYAPAPVVANAFCLDGSVEPFDVGIVIWPMQPSVSRLYAYSLQTVLEVPTVLRAVVTLYHSERIAKGCLSINDSLNGYPLP